MQRVSDSCGEGQLRAVFAARPNVRLLNGPRHIAGLLDARKLGCAFGCCARPQSPRFLAVHELSAASSKGLSPAMLAWCKSIETKAVASCKACGLDSSPENVERLFNILQPGGRGGNAETQACSNPACKGLFTQSGDRVGDDRKTSKPLTVQPRLKKCSRCLQVAYCRCCCVLVVFVIV